MKVILQHAVTKLGHAGDIVEASPGYFRNFLQPRGLAVEATRGTLKKREEDLGALKKKAELLHQAAVEQAEKISALGSIKLTAKVGEGGKLYGKITHKEIAQLIEKEVGFFIDKRLVKTDVDVHALGTFKVYVKLANDVQAELNLEVTVEEAAVV
jgi:large subunit ribosomal protein L9